MFVWRVCDSALHVTCSVTNTPQVQKAKRRQKNSTTAWVHDWLSESCVHSNNTIDALCVYCGHKLHMLALASFAVVRALCYSALVRLRSSTGREGMGTQVGLHSGLLSRWSWRLVQIRRGSPAGYYQVKVYISGSSSDPQGLAGSAPIVGLAAHQWSTAFWG